MTPPAPGETLLLPQQNARKTTALEGTRGLSTEIVSQSARRLRILALLYAFTFFMSSFVPILVSEANRVQFRADLMSGFRTSSQSPRRCSFRLSR